MTSVNVFGRPEFFPVHIAPWENKVVFVLLPQQFYQSLAFLDHRHIPVSAGWELPLDALARTARMIAKADRRSVHSILHMGFCGSTLIARCLDRLPSALVLKEPYPVHELASYKRHAPATGAYPEAWQSSFELMMLLLSRTFHPEQITIIKPTDASTNLLGDFLAYSDTSAALFLYIELEEYLAAVLKQDVRRRFVRERLDDLFVLCRGHPFFAGADLPTLTDAERAACLWLLNRHLYTEFVRDNPGARCRSLSFTTFLEDPQRALVAITRLFGVPASPEEIEAAVAMEAGVHAKQRNAPYTAADRDRSISRLAEQYRDEIREGLAWIERCGALPSVSEGLPLPLELDG